MKKSQEMVWPEMVTHGWVLSSPVGHVSDCFDVAGASGWLGSLIGFIWCF
jgi:hypothetical protein